MSENPIVSKPCKSESKFLLLVEGVNDCNAIYHLAARYNLENTFGIWEGGGEDQALKRFSGLLISADSKRPTIMGLVLDCDGPADGKNQGVLRRWQQVRDKLRQSPYQLPEAPNDIGTILDGPVGYPRIGIWLMPDNQSDGMLEDFLLALIPDQSKQFADQAATEAKLQGYGNYRDVHHSKAVAHTYLAWQDEPGKPLGLAIKAGMFKVEDDNAFVGWLKALFSPVAA